MSLAFIILAAGKGTRMASDLPKVLHPVARAPLIAHAIRAAATLTPEVTVVVAGHGAGQVHGAVERVDPQARVALQSAQLGTAHAVAQAQDALADFSGDVIVLYGDTPFIRSGTLRTMQEARRGGADVVVLGFEAAQPGRYGRLITRGDRLERIFEARDAAEAVWQARRREEAMRDGVTLVAPETVHFAFDTVLGRDVEIEPNVVFGPGVTVDGGARLRAFSHLEGCHVAPGAVIGPYARLRPGTRIGPHARVGNFVEIKSADIAEGAKINHLSYVGDAEIGAGANIGAGTITCNYDGVMKHRTWIGAGAFIGSNAALVAPVSVGAEAMVAAGSTITGDVPDGALALARGKQSNKPGLARRLRARLMDLKAKASGGQ